MSTMAMALLSIPRATLMSQVRRPPRTSPWLIRCSRALTGTLTYSWLRFHRSARILYPRFDGQNADVPKRRSPLTTSNKRKCCKQPARPLVKSWGATESVCAFPGKALRDEIIALCVR